MARIHFTDIARDLRRGIEGIDPDGPFLEVEAGKFPEILFHAGIHLRREQVLEDRRPGRGCS